MKKLWKILIWVGAVILGIFAMSTGRGSKKQFKKDLKDNKKKIKSVNKKIKTAKKANVNINKTLASKKKALKEIKDNKKKLKVKSVGADEAADFLKKYSKKKK